MKRPSQLRAVLLASWSLLLLPPAVRAAEPSVSPAGESERLHRLLDVAWEEKLRQTPELATYTGLPGHNDRWSDLSPASIERRHGLLREQLKALQSIDRGRLAPAEQMDFDLFRRRLEGQIEGFRFPDDQLVLSQYGGLQLDVPRILALAPAASLHDYEDLLARLGSLPALVDQDLALLEQGLAAGVTPPKSMLRGVPDQVRALLPDDPWRSPLLAPFQRLPAGVLADDQARIRQAALDAYEKKAAPAFRKLLPTTTPPSSKVGGSMPRPWGAKWVSIATPTPNSASSATRCGGPCAWWSTRGFTLKGGRNSRRSSISGRAPPRTSAPSRSRSTGISPIPVWPWPTRSGS